jgi:hypothetical protein
VNQLFGRWEDALRNTDTASDSTFSGVNTELKGTLETSIADLNHVEATVAQIERKPAMFPHISDVSEGEGIEWRD